MNSSFHNLLSKSQTIQRTTDWYLKRYNILTASCIASIFDANPYLSKLDLLIQKCKPFNVEEQTNEAIQWGIKYEPIAYEIYEKLKGEKVHQVGLFIHDVYTWLGASPDGLRDSGKLLEIKCVWNRKVTQEIPLYYWMQVQIQLEVCDLEECDLFQCKFTEYKNKTEYLSDKFATWKGIIDNSENKPIYWKLEKYSLNTIYRNREWFKNGIPILYKFWKDIIKYRRIGYEKLLSDIKHYSDINYFSYFSYFSHLSNRDSSYNFRKRKRIPSPLQSEEKNGEEYETPNKKVKKIKKIDYIKENWIEWINATDTKNYMLNDPIIDWLNLYGKNEFNKYQKDSTDDFNEHLGNQEIKFVSAIHGNLFKRFPNEIVKIADIHEKFSVNKYHRTIFEMINGRPIIIQGILHNKNNLTYAIPDLIVRKDYIKKIIDCSDIEIEKIDEFNVANGKNKKAQIKFDYRIINIKYLSLIIKNNLIVNTGNVVAYKSELIICNQSLGPILGYVPENAYILGRKYKEKEKCYDSFNNIGKIDMVGYDNKLVSKTQDAINWIREVKKDGHAWDIMKPHRIELYPNMSNQYDYPWHQFKKKIAVRNEEITLLWNCGTGERKKLHQNGINSWKKIDSNMIEKIIGFKKKKGKILENIIKINTNPSDNSKIILNPNNAVISDETFYFFIDFETVNSLDFDFCQIENYDSDRLPKYLEDSNDRGDLDNLIYLIGIGWIHPVKKRWIFRNFLVDRLRPEDEKKIIVQWLKYMKKIEKKFSIKNSKICHWSNAEIIFANRAFKRHGIKINLEWYDLLDFFKSNAIAVKGAFNYGLKNIAGCLHKNKLIKTRWHDTTLDGTSAMLAAWEAEKLCIEGQIEKLIESKKIGEISRYNEVDCRALYEIMDLFVLKKMKNI